MTKAKINKESNRKTNSLKKKDLKVIHFDKRRIYIRRKRKKNWMPGNNKKVYGKSRRRRMKENE